MRFIPSPLLNRRISLHFAATAFLLFFVVPLSMSEVTWAVPVAAGRLVGSQGQLRRGLVREESRFALTDPYPRFEVEIPAGAELTVAFTVTDLAWKNGLEEITFSVSFQHEEQRHTLVQRSLTKDGENGWQEVTVPLDSLAGKVGELALQTKVVRGTLPDPQDILWAPPVVAAEAPNPGLNIVLLSIDTLRADRLGCYGNPRDTSPHIDRLAKQGVLFKQAIAPSSWTLPSHASMFTGVYPHKHGGVKIAYFVQFDRSLETLAGRLWDAGYATAAFTGGGFISPQFGFDKGFDLYSVDAGEKVKYDTRFRQNVQRAIDWIKKQRGRRFFLFLHTYTVHLPYTPSPPYDTAFDPDYPGPFKTRFTQLDFDRHQGPFDARTIEHLKALYDGEIRSTDEVFAEFLANLKSSGLDQSTCVIVTSDHGEEFQEHGDMFHNHAKLYEELIRVPLVVWCPSRYSGGRVIEEPVSLVDILPTILDMAGAPIPQGVDGVSLEQALRGRALPDREHTLSEVDGSLEKRAGSVVALRGDRYKLIRATWDSSPLVFDLQYDPQESRNLSQVQPELTSTLERALSSSRELPASTPAAPSEKKAGEPDETWDPALEERLRALGYID